MSKKITPLFLERHGYRQRRIVDAARLLPIVGCFLFLVPVLWSGSSGEQAEKISTASAMLYLFGVWGALSVGALVLSLKLDPSPTDEVSAPDAADTQSIP